MAYLFKDNQLVYINMQEDDPWDLTALKDGDTLKMELVGEDNWAFCGEIDGRPDVLWRSDTIGEVIYWAKENGWIVMNNNTQLCPMKILGV